MTERKKAANDDAARGKGWVVAMVTVVATVVVFSRDSNSFGTGQDGKIILYAV